MSPDDRVCAYQKQYGYVGFGIVTTSSVPVPDFKLDGKRILEQRLDCPEMITMPMIYDFLSPKRHQMKQI